MPPAQPEDQWSIGFTENFANRPHHGVKTQTSTLAQQQAQATALDTRYRIGNLKA